MVIKDWDGRFSDLHAGVSSSEERAQFDEACSRDEALRLAWLDFQKVVQEEARLRGVQYRAPASLQVKVMNALEQEDVGFFRRLVMNTVRLSKAFAPSVAMVALLLIAVRVVNDGVNDGGYVQSPIGVPPKIQERLEINAPPPVDPAGGSVTTGSSQSVVTPLTPVAPLAPNQREFAKEEAKRNFGAADKSPLPYTSWKAIGAAPVMQERNLGMHDAIGGIAEQRGKCYDCVPEVPTQEVGRDRYTHYGENPRVSPLQQPLSTFSVDVDTGSYTNLRRHLLTEGRLPSPDAVRIEELLNYFRYDYPSQSAKPFAVYSEMAESPLEPGKWLLKLGVRARDAKENETPWNLVFLVDVSGSMASSDRLPLAKSALKYLVTRMRPHDRISLVTYAGNAGVALQSTSVSQRETINAAIDGLGAGGSTFGSGGIHLAYQIAEQSRIANGVNRVVLVTDGDFNVGVTSNDELIRLVEGKRETGITLTTVGVGTGNYNEGMMEQIANKGNGNFFYLDSFKEAQKVFGADLFGTMEVVAKDVKLQVEFNPAAVAQYRLIGYENRKLRDEDFANDRIDAGEIGSGHTVTALYELVLTGTPLAQSLGTGLRYQKQEAVAPAPVTGPSDEVGFVKVRFKTPQGSTSELMDFPLVKSQIVRSGSEVSPDLRFAAAVSYFGHILRRSSFMGAYSLGQVAALAESALGRDEDGNRREFVQMVRSAEALGAGK